MEQVAYKSRRDESLNLFDLKAWVTYNFLALPADVQEKVLALTERQRRFWIKM